MVDEEEAVERPESSWQRVVLALTLGMPLGLAMLALGVHWGADLGTVSYSSLVPALAKFLSRPGTASLAPGYFILGLWSLLPVIFISGRISRKGSSQRGPSLRGGLRALASGYGIGICFALLSYTVYYGCLQPILPVPEEFTNPPSVTGVLADWWALSNALVSATLYGLLPLIFRFGKTKKDPDFSEPLS